MSGPESQKPDDRLLDEWLAGEGAVRDAYRATAQERAPSVLDAAILAAAREAARATPPPRRAARRWQPALATAAVLVLSLGVLLQVQRDPVARQATIARPEAAVSAASPAPVPAPSEAMREETAGAASSAVDAAVAEPAPAPKSEASKAAKPAPPQRERRATAEAMPAPPPPPPPQSPPPSAAAPAMAMDAAPATAEPLEDRVAIESMASQQRRDRAAEAERANEAAMLQRRQAPAESSLGAMSKLLRAPVTPQFMTAPEAAPASAAAIEHWARSCELPAAFPQGERSWRGLAVRSWSAQADATQRLSILRFATSATREEITAALGVLAARAEFRAAGCAVPVVRELRADDGWSLVCECARTSGN